MNIYSFYILKQRKKLSNINIKIGKIKKIKHNN